MFIILDTVSDIFYQHFLSMTVHLISSYIKYLDMYDLCYLQMLKAKPIW